MESREIIGMGPYDACTYYSVGASKVCDPIGERVGVLKLSPLFTGGCGPRIVFSVSDGRMSEHLEGILGAFLEGFTLSTSGRPNGTVGDDHGHLRLGCIIG